MRLFSRLKWRVALRKESVDRNLVGCIDRTIDIVALRKESVDRNIKLPEGETLPEVALRKESVDRNATLASEGGGSSCRSPQGERG